MEPLGTLPGYSISAAGNVSADGSVVVGNLMKSGDDGKYVYQPFRWTEAEGMVGLGHMPDTFHSHGTRARGVSADGSVIVGDAIRDEGPPNHDPFIWDQTHGMRNLSDVLTHDYGLDLTGWHLATAEQLSADGTVIVGLGYNPAGEVEPYRAVIPEPSSLVLLGCCAMALLAYARPKRRRGRVLGARDDA